MSTMYSIGQMNQLADALESAGFTPGDVTELRSFAGLDTFKGVLKGLAKIVVVKHVIDCDKDPFVPEGWKVECHKKSGQMEWSPSNVRLHLSANQQDGKAIKGDKLRLELVNEPVLNANVLDYLLANPELIPDSWKGKAVFFWGTVYRSSDGHLYVRCLYWDDGRWGWGCSWLGHDFVGDGPAACSQVSS